MAQISIDELNARKQKLGRVELRALYEVCQSTGGCVRPFEETSGVPQQYCQRCLTLYAQDIAVDPPDEISN